MATTIGSYRLRIMAEDSDERVNIKVLDDIVPVLSNVEEDISDSLPEGYYCKIEHWQ